MFQDLVDLFSGWYSTYVETIRDLLQYTVSHEIALEQADGTLYTSSWQDTINPDIWSAYVPWEHIIAAVTLIVFTVCVFKFMRSVLCKIL